MELRKGYQQTEVGAIPEDWIIVKLGELIEFKNGLNKEKKYFGYGTPIINYMDVFRQRGLYSTQIYGKVFLTRGEINAYQAKKGDLFFTRTSETVDEIGISSVLLDDSNDTVFSGFVLRGREKNDKLNNEFKKYCFSEREVRKQIISSASYTTRALTNGRLLSQILLKVPTIAEQKAIANALSDMDALISSLEQLIEKKKAIKLGAMQELLKPKEGWVTKKLGEIVEYKNGKAHENSVVDDGDFIIVNSKFVSTEGEVVKYSNSNLCHVAKDEILMVLSDVPNGRAIAKCFYVRHNNKYTLNQRICSLKAITVYPQFLFYIVNRNKYFLSFDDGVKQTNLRNEDVLKCPLNLPPTIDEQRDIASIILDMEEEITFMEHKLKKLTNQKQAMMQVLLTGKIRLV